MVAVNILIGTYSVHSFNVFYKMLYWCYGIISFCLTIKYRLYWYVYKIVDTMINTRSLNSCYIKLLINRYQTLTKLILTTWARRKSWTLTYIHVSMVMILIININVKNKSNVYFNMTQILRGAILFTQKSESHWHIYIIIFYAYYD